MSIELTQRDRATGARWGTINTKLAACLLVYGYRLCAEQPFIRMGGADNQGKLSTSIWFTPEHPSSLITDSTTQDWEVAWRHWDELKLKTGRYQQPPDWAGPLRVMRRALDARQWFSTSFRGANEPLPAQFYRTEDRAEVACLISMGLHIFSSLGGGFVFDEHKVGVLRLDYCNDGKITAMQFAKRAIVQYETLRMAMQRPDNTPNIQFKVGEKIALIPVNCPPSVREPLVRLLHA